MARSRAKQLDTVDCCMPSPGDGVVIAMMALSRSAATRWMSGEVLGSRRSSSRSRKC